MRKKDFTITIRLFTLSLLSSALLSSYSVVSAQEIETEPSVDTIEINDSETSPSASPSSSLTPTGDSITSVETSEISGEVVKSENSTITIKTSSNTVEVPLSSNIKITRDGEVVGATSIKAGDKVTATIDSSTNQALVLEATAGETAKQQQYVLPAILGALLLLGLIFWLVKKSQRQRIKTTQTNL